MPGITTSLTPSAIGTANIAGLGSGINFNTTVDKLIAVEKRKVTLLTNQQQLETNKQTSLNTLNSNLTTLRAAAQSLADGSTFFSNTSTLTSSTATDPNTLLKVTADSTAVSGTHTVVVTQLAQAQKLVSNGSVKDAANTAITSISTALGFTSGSSFSIQGKASVAHAVTVNSTDSLQDIVNNINALNSGSDATGVTASILQVGTSAFRLVLTADQTGAANGKIKLTSLVSTNGTADLEAGGTLANLALPPTAIGNNTGTDIQQQIPLDATLTVDGVSGITRDTNTVADVLPGFTLNLIKADTGSTITTTTAIDQAAIKAKIKSFVGAYNTIKTFINKQMVFDTKTQTNGILASDATVRTVNSQLSSSILTSVTGLPAGKDSMVLFGVAPDSTGQLVIDDVKLTSSLSTDTTAVRNVFAAAGTGSVSSLQFIAAAANTVGGTYAVDITTAAARAKVTGTTVLAAGIGATTDAVTVTDGAGRIASLTLDGNTTIGAGNQDGRALAAIVSSLNTEFAAVKTEQRRMKTPMLTGTAGGTPATSTTLLKDLTNGTTNLNIAAGDTVTIAGTNRGRTAVNFTYTVLNPNTDTLGSLLSSIQVAFNQQVTASVDSAGKINITDNASGDSNLTLNLTANNEGSGTLNFGTEAVVTEGRYALDLTAAASGNFLKIQGKNFGPGSNFTVTQNGTTSDLLGLGGAVSGADFLTTVANGADVVGTIGGLAATGSGQLLTGNSGSNVDGLTLLYAGSTTGAIGNMTVSLGSGFLFGNLMDTFTNPITGLVQSDISASKTTFNALQTRINDMNARIKQDRVRLTKQFQQMEILINNFKAQGNFLSQQVGFNIKKG